MIQLPTAATVRHASEGCDSSIRITGTTSSASATIAHSSECVTRPFGSWRQCIPRRHSRPPRRPFFYRSSSRATAAKRAATSSRGGGWASVWRTAAGDGAEHRRQAELEDAVGEHRGGGEADRRAVGDEHADQAALGSADAARGRQEGARVAERVGEDEDADGGAPPPKAWNDAGEARDVEGEVG